MTHDFQLNSNRSWFSEAAPNFWAHESSGESQETALKTTLGPIEASRAAIQPIESPRAELQMVARLQLTGFQVDSAKLHFSSFVNFC